MNMVSYGKPDVSHDLLSYRCHIPGERSSGRSLCSCVLSEKVTVSKRFSGQMQGQNPELCCFSRLCGLIEDVFLFVCCSPGLGF